MTRFVVSSIILLSFTYDHALSILLGGRAAEEIALHHRTTGAGNDLERATDLARKMVTEWGMSEKLGPLTFGKKDEHIFLGKEIARHKDYSEKTAIDIDEEIKRIVLEAYSISKKILAEHYDLLDALAKALLEKETLDGEEIDALIRETESKRPVQV